MGGQMDRSSVSVHTLRYDDPLVVSPSQTQLWLRCPMLAHLVKIHGLYTLPVRLGRRAAHAINCYRKYTTPMTDDAKMMSVDRAALQACHRMSGEFGGPLYTELTLGKARIDEVFALREDGHTYPLILDYKYVMCMTGDNDDVCMDYAYSHQLLHYAWAYSQYVGMWTQDNFMMAIGVCVFSDLPGITVRFGTWFVDKQRLMTWLDNAIEVWWKIKLSQEGDIWKNVDSCCSRQYGMCSQYVRCWGTIS